MPGIPLENLRGQLQKIKHLAQPFFLPTDQASGWTFLWLIASLLFCVNGITFALLTAALKGLEQLDPSRASKYLGGVEGFVHTIWHSWWGALFAGLFVIGLISFVRCRKLLKQGRWKRWLMFGAILIGLLGSNALIAGLSFVSRDLLNALNNRSPEEFKRALLLAASCIAILLPIIGGLTFLQKRLSITWREWLSTSLIHSYLTNQAFYTLNPNDEADTNLDNPDQRISEDTRAFTSQSVNLAINISNAILSFATNILILWSISSKLTLTLFAYALSVTTIITISGKKLININFKQLRYEANFRYSLVHIRDNAESIAFYAGEPQEKKENIRRLGQVVSNYKSLINWETAIEVAQTAVSNIGIFLPYIILGGQYFAGNLDIGALTQASINFGVVQSSLLLIVNQYNELANFIAGISRLEGFQSNVEQVSLQAPSSTSRILPGSDAIVIRSADLFTPNGSKPVIKDLTLSVSDHDKLLVVGPSGCGKTSLLRMISGLWDPSRGTVERPETGDLLFIPQKPYMLLGSLREQLCYPTDEARFSDEQLRSVLEQVNLSKLVSRYPDLDIKQDWPRILSLGEQQRLAFGRLLLNSPRFVVLDEATSALDVKTEKYLYNLLVERNLAFISVGHRPALKQFHSNVLQLAGNGDWNLIPAANYDPEAA